MEPDKPTEHMHVMVTPRERKEIEVAARAEDRPLSAWMRGAIRAALRARKVKAAS
mgnify:CR=1 FL=1